MKRGYLIKKYGLNKCSQKLVNDTPRDVIDCVCECCLNYIKGNVLLTNAQKQKFQARK